MQTIDTADLDEPLYMRLLSARLFTLLRLIRDSGVQAYERRLGLKELPRQLITMLGFGGALGSHELVALTGQEKAQISRAVKKLEEQGLITRPSLRAKLTLTEKGHDVFRTIMKVGLERDAKLTSGLSADEREQFSELTRSLTVRAAQLYHAERQIAGDPLAPVKPPEREDLFPAGFEDMPRAKLLTPAIISLVAYLKRSAMLTYQREHGLSNFQWQLLSLIGQFSPLPLARLIEVMDRDKSQVGRTVAHLEEEGLIDRQRLSGKRDIVLVTTPRGASIYASMCVIALRRDEALTDRHTAEERDAYVSLIDRLSANARALAADEQKLSAGTRLH